MLHLVLCNVVCLSNTKSNEENRSIFQSIISKNEIGLEECTQDNAEK